jgi:hypothetical protein
MPIKWSLDDTYYDTRDLNNNAVSIFRYAEVLLNYAEAQAELGVLTDADWTKTVGALRKRAGITGGLTTKPTVVDTYLQTTYFPNISDPVILEIRRDRGIELALEGFRFYDIMRWKRGDLMTMIWNGMYVPALNVPMDLNEDGTNDVLFYKGTAPAPISGVIFINVSATLMLSRILNVYQMILWRSYMANDYYKNMGRKKLLLSYTAIRYNSKP